MFRELHKWLAGRAVTYPVWVCRIGRLHWWSPVGHIKKSYSETEWSYTVVHECVHCEAHQVTLRRGPKLSPVPLPPRRSARS